MRPDRPTPRLTDHARERCVEMAVRTKVVKSILRDPDLDVPSSDRYPGFRVATSRSHPDYAVPYFVADDGVPVAVTVLFNTRAPYVRVGATYELTEERI